MDVTKSIKYAKYKMRVYSMINGDVKVVTLIYFNNTTLKQIKKDLEKDGLMFLQIISTEHYTKRYAMEINKFIANATEI